MEVFIADDSAIIRERLADLLSSVPEIELIGHAEEVTKAIHSIQKLNPDVVIFDFQMADGKGLGVLKSVKRNKPTPIFIVFTNHSYPQYREKCMSAGADYFFDKSTEFEEMMEVLRKMICNSCT